MELRSAVNNDRLNDGLSEESTDAWNAIVNDGCANVLGWSPSIKDDKSNNRNRRGQSGTVSLCLCPSVYLSVFLLRDY